MNKVYQKLEECLKSVREKTDFKPEVALILGSGLGDYADGIQIEQTISYTEIQGFPTSTVAGHKGRFVFGYVKDVPVVIMQGRVHFYEGYPMSDVVLPTRLMGMMGAKKLVLTNAAGGINTDYNPGDFMLIMAFPIMGVALYLLVGLNGSTQKMRNRFQAIDDALLPKLPDNNEILKQMQKKEKGAAGISTYIKQYSGYPVYQNTDILYFDDAAKGLEAQLAEMKKAQKFIFMEYHAIEDKESWHRIQTVLEERVKAGVEVRVFYDDMGSIGFINTDFVKKLEAVGIRCRVFNPFAPGLNLFLNNRDHRKITVIDGKVGFTGGYNLANEYFNLTHPYGQWKDTGIRLEGDAVKSLTVTFLEMWNASNHSDQDDTEIDRYLPQNEYTAKENGYIQPYADSPMDHEHIGEEVYISMVNKAEEYCYFMTPYLIITDEMTHALSLAAKRGVDVRIITPGIPDKKVVYGVTRSFYNGLVRNGVRIFEWEPGFCHAKMSIADDKMATCGTINLDYRSLYHHFENGCFMYDCRAVADMKKDFDRTFCDCREVTEQYRTGRSATLRLGQLFLRLFAQLL